MMSAEDLIGAENTERFLFEVALGTASITEEELREAWQAFVQANFAAVTLELWKEGKLSVSWRSDVKQLAYQAVVG